MDALIDSSIPSDDQEADESSDWHSTPFSVLKTDPGRVSLKSVLRELEKLSQIETLALPDNLFAAIQPKILRHYRLRAAVEPPREVRRHPEPIRYTMLAAFCWQRRQEIIDGLVDLLIQIVHRISVRAEKKVVDALLGDLQKVHGKTTLLFKIAEAALEQPEGVVREVLYPVVSEQTLSDLVKEYRSHGPTYRRHVYTILRASYSGHYRRMLPPVLEVLDFRANTATHRPIIKALAFIKANRDSRKQHFLVDGTVPIDGVVPPHWRELVLEQDPSGEIRVNRINYEISALHSLREGLRCKAIWVAGADRFRNSDDDLPADFDVQRTTYYAALQQPESADDFLAGVRTAMEKALSRFHDGLPKNPHVTLRVQGKNRIKLSPLDPQPEPATILRVKAELMRRWPMTSLLDVLKETDLRLASVTPSTVWRHGKGSTAVLCNRGCSGVCMGWGPTPGSNAWSPGPRLCTLTTCSTFDGDIGTKMRCVTPSTASPMPPWRSDARRFGERGSRPVPRMPKSSARGISIA